MRIAVGTESRVRYPSVRYVSDRYVSDLQGFGLSGSGAAYARALLLAQRGDFSAAIAMATNAPLADGDGFLLGTRENESMVGFLEALEMLHDEERGVHDLDSSEVASALQAMDGKYSRGWNRISNLICFHYGECRPPLTGGSKVPKSLLPVSAAEEPLAQPADRFRIYPNPAHTQITLDYHLQDTEGTRSAHIHDLSGREVGFSPMQGDVGLLTLDIAHFAPGLYVLKVIAGNRVVHMEKFVVQQ